MTILISAFCAVLVSTTLYAADPFVGTWIYNAKKSQFTGQIYKIEDLGNKRYRLTNIDGVSTILPCDGSVQQSRFGGTVSLKQLDDHTLQYTRKRTNETLTTMTADDDTLNWVVLDTLADGQQTKEHVQWHRVGTGRGLAGDWSSESFDSSQSEIDFRIEPFGADGLSFITPSQKERTDMRFDGKDYENKGPNVSKVLTSSGKRVDSRTIQIVDKLNGTVRDTGLYKISEDDKTMTYTEQMARGGKAYTLFFERK